ncbi:response regulator transcription factor [Paenibacillus harenae]|uniref:response regulator transcription factor n=1 Tax=Paenibacillus harenae TaxID=306543 RepID=UPI000425CFB4|nr:response regulator [Paenibacillus harenae]
MQNKTILIVDDEPRTRQGIKKTLEAWAAGQYTIETASSAVEVLAILDRRLVQLLITDIRMPELGGLAMIEALQSKPHKPVVIVISGHPEFDYAQKALQLGVVDYLLKPIDKAKLVRTVEQALQVDEKRNRIEKMEKLVDTKLLETGDEESRYSPPVREAIAYIDTHLGEAIGMRQLADMLHLNPSYFSVLFKEQTQLTFSDYLTRRRMQRAKQLLAQTRLSIGEIAEQVGYQTDKYFIKVFKSMENTSPSKYRSSLIDGSDII